MLAEQLAKASGETQPVSSFVSFMVKTLWSETLPSKLASYELEASSLVCTALVQSKSFYMATVVELKKKSYRSTGNLICAKIFFKRESGWDFQRDVFLRRDLGSAAAAADLLCYFCLFVCMPPTHHSTANMFAFCLSETKLHSLYQPAK